MKKVTVKGNNLLEKTSDDWGGVNSGSSAITVHGTTVPPNAEWGVERGEVERFLKEQLNGKAGVFHYDSMTTKYLVFADEDSKDLYLSDRETYAGLLLGSFDAPANYTAEITMTTPSSNVILGGTTGNYIDFTFDIKNKSGASTGDSVVATFTFNNAGSIQKETRIYNAGTNVHFLADGFLSEGTNTVTVSISGRNTLVSTVSAVTFMVINLSLTSSFNFADAVTKGSYLHVPYTIKGANVKYVEWYVDGVLQQTVDTVIGLNVTATKDFDTAEMLVGKHSVQARAYVTEGGANYYSNTLYFDFIVKPADSIWEADTTHVLMGLVLAGPLTSGTPSIVLKQYDTYDFGVYVFDSRGRALDLIITDNGEQVKSVAITVGEPSQESYSPMTTGNHVILLSAGGTTATFSIVAQASDIDISEETDALLLKLSAKGRSNNESHPDTWDFTQAQAQGGATISTEFTGFDWNAQSGWDGQALVIPSGASIEIGMNPLAGNPITKGRTIEVDLEALDIDDETASILSLVSGTTGLSVLASSAKLQTAGGTKVETRFRDGDRLHLTFIINRTDDTDNARMLYIVNNGVLERASQFAANDTVSVSGDSFSIGSSGCKVRLFGVRVYDKALSVDQSFQNFAIDSPSLVSVATSNDIYDERGNISVDKVSAHIPVMIITGDISSIMSISDKSHKNDWNANPVDIEFRNMQNPEMNFFIDDADIRLQGTSSISYPRKNFRIYSKSKSGKYATKLYTPTHNEDDLVASGKYSFKTGSAPVSCWCLKADFAESSGSHNTGIARLWNSVMKSVNQNGNYILRTDAQKWAAQNEYPYDVRTTIDGFPIVLFQRDNENAPMVCLGQYNFNNDKSTEDVFGFTALTKEGATPFDNSAVECWEVLDSDNSIALFTDVSDFDNSWDNAFEARYPDKNNNTTALKAVCQFLNGCYDSLNDTVDVATWRAGKADHFDLNKLAAYYIYLLRFGAVDQTVKNAMFTTEDGQHWFYINYDNDTVLGIDNESRQFDVWDYGLFTQTPQGGYYYAGKGKSVLWRLFEADSECMALARQIDALLFNAGLTYEKICEMFDDLQSGQWCERVFNENGRYKYISQALAGQNVLHMLQGSRKSHRHWWLQHRLEKYDNMFGNGTYSIRSIQARATGTVNIPQGAAYKYTPAISSSFGYAVASTVVDAPTQRTAGTEYTATGLPQATGVGNLIYIYNANNLKAIDLSAYISALGSLNIGDAVDVNGSSRLTDLVLGDGENTNAYLNAISGLGSVKSLEEIDIRGYQAITAIDLSAQANLHVFSASGSGLTSFAPAAGVNLTSVTLPSTIQSIALNGASVATMTYTATTTLRSLSLRNVIGTWDVKTFVLGWLNLLSEEQLANAELTLTGINWTGMSAADVLKLGSVGTRNLQGKVTLSSLTQEQYNQLLLVFGPSAFVAGSTFVINAPSGVFISGPSSLLEGAQGQFTAAVFPAGSGSAKYKMFANGTVVSPQTDGQGRVYRAYQGITLYEATGIIVVGTVSSNVTVTVGASVEATGAESNTISFTGVKVTYPSSLTIGGKVKHTETGSSQYTRQFDTDNFTAEILSSVWSLSANNACAITAQTASAATLNVIDVTATAVVVTLTLNVTLTGNQTMSATKEITIKEPFEYQEVDLGLSKLWCNANIGADSIDDDGDYFAWGDVTGHGMGEGYDFSQAAYNASSAASISAKLSLEQDAARQVMGGDWFMPTKEDWQELYNGTDREWTTVNGKAGYKFYNKSDHTKFIFIPASGYYNGTTLNSRGTYGYLWSSAYSSSSNAYDMYFTSSGVTPQSATARYYGLPVRAIKKQPIPAGFVDFDLPSGTAWAQKNLGAESETDYGYHFSWGNIVGHKSTNGSTFDDGYDFGTSNSGPYASTPGASLSANIASSDADHDAAKAILGGRAHMPTKEQFQELYDNTDNEWTSINGIYGRKFMKKSDHSVYVFFPAAGSGRGTSLRDRGTNGSYWSSSFDYTDNAYYLYFSSSSVSPQNRLYRYYGYSVRAVM